MAKEIGDVVADEEIFRVSPKIQVKMQSRHNLMLNIQNISKIIGDIENAINRYSTILKSMELNGTKPHYRLMWDYMIPVDDVPDAMENINLQVADLSGQLDKHIEQVKSMQVQHDGLTTEIDLMLEVEKGKYKAGKDNCKTKAKARRNR